MKIYHTKSGKSQEAINSLVQKFKDGNLNMVADGIKFKAPDIFPSSKYSLRNQMMCYLQGDSIITGSYKFWKDNGRYPEKDTAVYIFAPMTKKTEDDEGNESYYVYGYRLINTYPIEGTVVNTKFDGEPLEIPELEPADLPPLTDIAEKLGLHLNWKPVPFDRWADFWAKGERINMGTDSPKVFFHELCHALHEAVDKKYAERSSQYQEVVAEFGSAVMMNVYLNEDSSGNAWKYIKAFAPDNPTEAIEQSLSMIQRMFTHLDKLQQEVAND